MTETEWAALAEEILVAMVREHTAVTVREIEARASDRSFTGFGDAPNPHHFSTARQKLLGTTLAETSVRTRGRAGAVTTVHLANAKGQRTAIMKTSARKRLLSARHLGWAKGTSRHPRGLIGPAGETALDTALRNSAMYANVTGETEYVFGAHVQRGSFDNSAALVVGDGRRQPPRLYTALFEVKNVREWFYDEDAELHRFLFKAASVQAANPDAPILPVFVCRRRHQRTLELGAEVGFYAVQYRTQLVKSDPEVFTLDEFNEVSEELGYQDIKLGDQPNNALRKALTESLPRDAAEVSELWRNNGPRFIDEFQRLLNRKLGHAERHRLVQGIRDRL